MLGRLALKSGGSVVHASRPLAEIGDLQSFFAKRLMPPQSPPLEYLYANRWRIWGVVMIGLFMALIDITIVNISIPQLQRDLHSPVNTVSWVLNAYNIVFAVLLVSMGRLADQFGRKRFFLTGMTIFTIGSFLCAISWSVGALITFRMVQAVGAGILAPIALATTTLVFPPAQRGIGLAMMAVVANTAAALGPPIGGLLVEFASWPWSVGWHWIFLINVPIGIVGILLTLRVVPETTDPEAGNEVDWYGMATLGGAIFCLTYGLVQANDKGWGSPEIVSLFVASALLTVAFGLSQRYGRFPMLTKGLIENRQFVGANISFFLFAIGMMGVLFMTVLAFVNLWGYSELKAALAITPVPLTGLFVAPLVGRLAGRFPPRALGLPALTVMAIALFWLSGFPAEPDYAAVVGPLILMGAGMGATFPAISIGSMGSIAGQELGLGSGIVNMSRQVGFAVGVALLVAVFSGTIDDQVTKARKQVSELTATASLSQAERVRLERSAFPNPQQPSEKPPAPRTPVERQARAIVADHVRDSYGTAFRTAAFVTLLAIPFSLTMRRRPGEVVSPEMAAAAAAGG
jgi:EmrB/QacA subfamily drug resistance transporter